MDKEISKIIKNNVWYRQACNSKAYYLFTPSRAAIKSLGAPYGFWLIRDNKYFDWFCPENNFVEIAIKVIAQQKNDPKWINKKIAAFDKALARLQKFYEFYKKKDIDQLDQRGLKDAILKLDSLVYEFWLINYICDYFDPTGEELLKDEIAAAGFKPGKNEIATLLRTKKLHYAQKERLEMLRMALNLKQKKIHDDQLEIFYKNHAKNYFYVDNSWESTRVCTRKDFSEKLEELAKKSLTELKLEIKDITNDWEAEHKKIIKKRGINKDLQAVFKLFRSVSYLRDVRKGSTLLTNHFLDSFYKKLSIIWNIPFESLSVALIEDLEKDYSAVEYRKIIEKRKGLIMESSIQGKSYFYPAEKTRMIYDVFHKSFNSETTEIKGGCACPGKISGIVRVVMGETHFSKFNDGEILVAPMTRPEYLNLIKRSAAIITDEGGLTCHAAIVARELKKPCIIGTKIATKVLKDGDLVEVDAKKGIVKKL